MKDTVKTGKRFEAVNDELEQLQKRMDETKSKADADFKKLRDEQARLSQIRQPLHKKIEEKRILSELIEGAKLKRKLHVELAAEFVQVADSMIGDSYTRNIADIFENNAWRHMRGSERAIVMIDSYIERHTAKLEAMEKDAADYASEHGLEHLLTPQVEPDPEPEAPKPDVKAAVQNMTLPSSRLISRLS